MSPLLIYIIKAACYTAAFYLVYSLFLSKDTLYGRNRAFILLSVLSAILLPLITIKTSIPVRFPIFGKTLGEVLITANNNGNTPLFAGHDTKKLILLLYFAGLLFFGIKLIIDLAGLVAVMSKSRVKGKRIVVFSGINTAAFSAFGYIFINSRLSSEEAGEIMRHEQNHLDKYHFFDIALLQIIKVFQWFNPFIYLFDRSLRAVHEYQADENYLRAGTSVVNYQQLIMNQILETRLFSISNSFSNPTLVKKRMIMMTKERTGILANLKLLMALPVIAMVLFLFSSCGEKTKSNESSSTEVAPPPPPPPPPISDVKGDSSSAPFVRVDELAVFKGGDEGLLKFISQNTRYPENAKNKGITGKVIVRFAVETDGSIDKISVLQGVDPELDSEALRVVSTLPKFEKPALLKDKPVAVWYMVPIQFRLK
jgi:TonB family protein